MTTSPEPQPGGYNPVPPQWQQPPWPGYPGHSTPGYPSPGYPGYPGAAPIGDSRSARKKLLTIAATLLTAALGAGLLAVWLFSGIFKAQPPSNAQFESGGSTSVEFKAGETKMIYGQSVQGRHKIHCDVNSSETAGGLSIEPINQDITINDWKAALSVTAQQPGRYTVTCKGSEGDVFGVGGPASVGRFGAPIIVGIISGALGLAGLVTGIVGLTKRQRPAP